MLPLQHKKSPNLWLKKEWEHESPATRKASSGRKLIKMISKYTFCYWNVHLNQSLVQPVLCAKYICDQKPKNTPINVKRTRLFISQKIIGTCTTLPNSSQTEIPIFPTMHFFLHFYFFFSVRWGYLVLHESFEKQYLNGHSTTTFSTLSLGRHE